VEIVNPTMGGEDFSEYSLPDHSIPAVDFHVGAVDPAKIAESKKPEKHRRYRVSIRASSRPCRNQRFALEWWR
jgi:hypothetical protein